MCGLSQGCVAVISLTWVTSVTLFAVMVLSRGGYYYNSTGLLACDPFFSRPSLRILSSCLFYFHHDDPHVLLRFCLPRQQTAPQKGCLFRRRDAG